MGGGGKHVITATGAFGGGAPYGSSGVCRHGWRRTHVITATWAFGGEAPCGASKRVRGVPTWVAGMR
eukprot:4491524-Pyramimonas_sp.AAC.1